MQTNSSNYLAIHRGPWTLNLHFCFRSRPSSRPNSPPEERRSKTLPKSATQNSLEKRGQGLRLEGKVTHTTVMKLLRKTFFALKLLLLLCLLYFVYTCIIERVNAFHTMIHTSTAIALWG